MKIDSIIDRYISEDKKNDVDLLRKQIKDTERLRDGALKDAKDAEKEKQIRATAKKHIEALKNRIEKLSNKKEKD